MAVNIIASIILVLVVAFVTAGTFIHNELPSNSKEYLSHKKKYPLLIDSRDNQFSLFKTSLLKNEITPTEFVAKFDSVNSLYHKDLLIYNNHKRTLLANQKVLGYPSEKLMALSVGIRFLALIIALFYFTSKVRQSYNSIYQKTFYLIISAVFLFITSYWMVWSLIYKVNSIGEFDFEPWHQNLLMYLMPLIVIISSYFIVKYIMIKEKLIYQGVNNSVIKLIALVKDLKINHYFKMAAKASNDNNQNEIKKDTKVLDYKIFSTLDEVLDET